MTSRTLSIVDNHASLFLFLSLLLSLTKSHLQQYFSYVIYLEPNLPGQRGHIFLSQLNLGSTLCFPCRTGDRNCTQSLQTVVGSSAAHTQMCIILSLSGKRHEHIRTRYSFLLMCSYLLMPRTSFASFLMMGTCIMSTVLIQITEAII